MLVFIKYQNEKHMGFRFDAVFITICSTLVSFQNVWMFFPELISNNVTVMSSNFLSGPCHSNFCLCFIWSVDLLSRGFIYLQERVSEIICVENLVQDIIDHFWTIFGKIYLPFPILNMCLFCALEIHHCNWYWTQKIRSHFFLQLGFPGKVNKCYIFTYIYI